MKKNFTLKSVFALIAAFALAMPAWADVTSVSDLFGKYKFTADMEVTSVGQSYTEYFSNDCDVVITNVQATFMTVKFRDWLVRLVHRKSMALTPLKAY